MIDWWAKVVKHPQGRPTLCANNRIAQVRRAWRIRGIVGACLKTTQKRSERKIFLNFQAKNGDDKEFLGIFQFFVCNADMSVI